MRGCVLVAPCRAAGLVRLSAPRRRKRSVCVRRQCSASSTPLPDDNPPLPAPAVFIGGSTALYVAMATASEGAAHFAGTPPILPSLLAVPPLEPTLTYMLPMLGSLAAALAGVEANFAPCVEVRDAMEKSVTPLLRVTSLPGLALLALGAGYGEEALFRGFLIPVAAASAQSSGVDGGVATALALGASSVVFGALHAVTPLYFAWATAAGNLFGSCLWLCTSRRFDCSMALTAPAAPQAGSTWQPGAS